MRLFIVTFDGLVNGMQFGTVVRASSPRQARTSAKRSFPGCGKVVTVLSLITVEAGLRTLAEAA